MTSPRDTDVLLNATAGVVGGGVSMATVCEVMLVDVSFEYNPVGRVANELGCWAEVLIKDNHHVIALELDTRATT
jgi:hypothetical protein